MITTATTATATTMTAPAATNPAMTGNSLTTSTSLNPTTDLPAAAVPSGSTANVNINVATNTPGTGENNVMTTANNLTVGNEMESMKGTTMTTTLPTAGMTTMTELPISEEVAVKSEHSTPSLSQPLTASSGRTEEYVGSSSGGNSSTGNNPLGFLKSEANGIEVHVKREVSPSGRLATGDDSDERGGNDVQVKLERGMGLDGSLDNAEEKCEQGYMRTLDCRMVNDDEGINEWMEFHRKLKKTINETPGRRLQADKFIRRQIKRQQRERESGLMVKLAKSSKGVTKYEGSGKGKVKGGKGMNNIIFAMDGAGDGSGDDDIDDDNDDDDDEEDEEEIDTIGSATSASGRGGTNEDRGSKSGGSRMNQDLLDATAQQKLQQHEEINSDLDDSDSDFAQADEGEEMQMLKEAILCSYDKVQRVKNKWKCTLKDGIMATGGKDYLFHKATGEFEW